MRKPSKPRNNFWLSYNSNHSETETIAETQSSHLVCFVNLIARDSTVMCTRNTRNLSPVLTANNGSFVNAHATCKVATCLILNTVTFHDVSSRLLSLLSKICALSSENHILMGETSPLLLLTLGSERSPFSGAGGCKRYEKVLGCRNAR